MIVLLSSLFVGRSAEAVPSFAAQTGQPCTACHIGAFGPQLTPLGRAFKLGGYTLDGGSGPAARMPLAGFVQSSFTHTNAGQPGGAAPRFGANNNPALDQISLFLAGRIDDNIGGFVQGTTNGIDHTVTLDNTDIRATRLVATSLGDLQLGIDVNNAPTVQDAYNSTFAWGFPYIASHLAPVPAASTVLASGLTGNSLGLTVYGWLDRTWYAEAGAYQSYGPSLLRATGAGYGPGATQTPAPYLRVTREWNWGTASAHIGAIALASHFNPATGVRTASGAFGHDSYLDLALDAGYQFLGDGTNIVSAYGIVTQEEQDLAGTANGSGGAVRPHNHLLMAQANVSYFYRNTYGLTLGVQDIAGNANPGLYAPAAISGSASGRPDSTALIAEADWIPFGKDDSWAAPFANLKLGVQYTAYTRFNGGTANYDGFGRRASDNNTLFAFAWLAF